MPTTFVCPHCKKSVEVSEALKHEIQEQVLATERDKHEKELAVARSQANETLVEELKSLREQMEKKDKELKDARAQELALRKERNELEDEKRSFELDKQRQIDEEREKIRAKTLEEVSEQHQLKEKEKDLVIDGLRRSLEDAQRKALQGSQQTHRAAMDLELENTLKQEFPNDKIYEVKKGTRGGDLVHEVWDRNGNHCGNILWEFKNTANWSDSWTDKLKEDKRLVKAELNYFKTKDGEKVRLDLDLSKAKITEIDGIALPVQDRDELLRYKQVFSRPIDLQDIKEITNQEVLC